MNPLGGATALCAMLAAAPCQASADTSVVLLLRTYSTAWSADEPCVHAGPTDAEITTLRLSCSSAVQLEARADEAAGWQLQHRHFAAGPFVLNHYQLSHPGSPAGRGAPLQIQLSW
jgi:hypothetical protein